MEPLATMVVQGRIRATGNSAGNFFAASPFPSVAALLTATAPGIGAVASRTDAVAFILPATASVTEAAAATVPATASVIESRASVIPAIASITEATASITEAAASIVEASLSAAANASFTAFWPKTALLQVQRKDAKEPRRRWCPDLVGRVALRPDAPRSARRATIEIRTLPRRQVGFLCAFMPLRLCVKN